MPNQALKSLVKDAPNKDATLKKAEQYWEDAKKQAKEAGLKEDSDNFYAYVMSIVKRRLGYKDKEESSSNKELNKETFKSAVRGFQLFSKLSKYFSKAADISVGDFVKWGYADGTAYGKVLKIVDDGKINVPDSSFEISGTKDDPAALIQVYDDNGKKTDTKVGHKVSTLHKTDKPS